MNKVILMGRLTRDPDIRYSNNQNGQMAIARFTLAVDRRTARRNAESGEQTADFISCVAFGAQADFAGKYLRKGTRMVVCGRLQTGSYEKNGARVYTTDVIVEELEFAESKSAASNNGGDTFGGNQSYGGGNFGGQSFGGNSNSFGSSASRPRPDSAIGDDFMNIPESVEDDSLPFH